MQNSLMRNPPVYKKALNLIPFDTVVAIPITMTGGGLNVVGIVFLVSVLSFANAGRTFTPLKHNYDFACVAENLKVGI